MTERNPIVVVILVFFTCGLYHLYHCYVTTQELASFSGRQLNAGMELAINVITCGLFGMYIEFRNTQIIDEMYKSRGVAHEEKAMIVGIMNVATFVIGATWFVATFIYQDELNKVSQLGAGAAPQAGQAMTF